MKKCLIMSDSFKGTLSSNKIIELFTNEVKKVFPNCEVCGYQVADGGEGTMEAFASTLNGRKVMLNSKDANLNDIEASYFISDENVAYMDVASCIFLGTTKNKDPFITSSFGVGLLIKDAIKNGCKEIVLGLGGSSTNDLGLGIVAALKGRFYNKENIEFLPTGGNLDEIENIDLSEFNKLIEGVKFTAMCDVNNPLIGENGCSMIYGIQKGATENSARILDLKMTKLANTLTSLGYTDVANTPGAGAAGGIGGSILLFFKGTLQKGINVLLNKFDVESKLEGVDVIFTGEGNFDSQTANGKVISGIKELANKHNIPVVVIAGGADIKTESELDNGIEAIVTTTRKPMAFKDLKPYSEDFYRISVENTLRLIALGEKIK